MGLSHSKDAAALRVEGDADDPPFRPENCDDILKTGPGAAKLAVDHLARSGRAGRPHGGGEWYGITGANEVAGLTRRQAIGPGRAGTRPEHGDEGKGTERTAHGG